MTGPLDPVPLKEQVLAFRDRIGDLKSTRRERPGDALSALDTSLLELETAHEELRVCVEELNHHEDRLSKLASLPDEALAAAFAAQPVSFLLLDRHGTVRRANRAAMASGFFSGRPFVLWLGRAGHRLLHNHLSALQNDEGPASLRTVLRDGSPVVCTLWRVDPSRMIAMLLSSPARTITSVEPLPRTQSPLRATARSLAVDFADCVIMDVECDEPPYHLVALADALVPGAAGVRVFQTTLGRGWTPGRYLMRTGTPVLDHPISDDTEILRLTGPITGGWRAVGGSLLGMPIQADGTTCGAVTAIRGPDRTPFDAADWSRMRRLSNQLSGMLGEPQATDPDPVKLPEITGMSLGALHRPAKNRSCDFYDIFATASSWWFAVADVFGDDLETTTMVKHSLRALARHHDHPAAVLDDLNELMLDSSRPDRSVTVLLAELRRDGDPGRIRLGSAGHARAAVISPGEPVRFLPGGGMPLGLFEDARAASDELKLGEGDMVMLSTDGVTEARDTAGDPLGEDGLADILGSPPGLPPCELVKRLSERLDTDDEVVMLALSRSVNGRKRRFSP